MVADFSNMELRVIAHYSGDEVYKRAFEHGEDLHAKTASTQFSVPYEDILKGVEQHDAHFKQIRAIGKLSNFGLSYGMGAKAFRTRLLVDSGVTVTVEEADNLIKGYRSTYPQAEAWKARTVQRGYELGYVRTMTGRKRRLPNLYSSDRGEVMRAERQIPNFCVQGSSADITGLALIEMYKRLKLIGAYPLLQVHDELVVEAPESKAQEAAAIMEACMGEYVNQSLKLMVPMEASAGIGSSWYEAK